MERHNVYLIEAMLEGDIPEVSKLERRCFTNPWPASAYRRELRKPGQNCYLVLRDEGGEFQPPNFRDGAVLSLGARLALLSKVRRNEKSASRGPIVGFAGFWHVFDEAHITTIGVDPDLRGRSLGELMLVALIEEGIGRGAGYLSLEVRVSNDVAIRLYEKYEFSVKGIRPRYYVDDGEDAYVMWSPNIRDDHYRRLLDDRREELGLALAGRADLPPPGGNGHMPVRFSGNGTQ